MLPLGTRLLLCLDCGENGLRPNQRAAHRRRERPTIKTMNPQTPQAPARAFTDEQIDQIIETLKPQLRPALDAVLSGKVHSAGVQLGTIPTPGAPWQALMYICAEPLAYLVNGVLGGYPQLMGALMKASPQAKTPIPESAPKAKSEAFSL